MRVLGRGSKLCREDPVTCGVRWSSYRLSSHVLLAFWAFAGVVMVTGHSPPPGLLGGEGVEGWGEAERERGGTGLRGSPSRRHRLSKAPLHSCRPSTGPAPHPAPAVRTAAAATPRPGPRLLAEFARSAGAAQTAAPAAAAAALARALGPYVTSACPSTPLPAAWGNVSRHSRSGWNATWTPGFPRPRDAPDPRTLLPPAKSRRP